MNKIVRRLRPSNYWRIGEHESWFQDMAAEGLHLKKMGQHFAKFVKDEPRQMKYRIDVTTDREAIEELKEIYRENGWDYVTTYGNFNVFSSPAERNATELHTDPAEQAYTLANLNEKLIWNAGFVFISTVLMVVITAFTWFANSTPILALVEGSIIQQTILTILILYVAYTSLQAAISIGALRKTLLEGKPINHNAQWRRQRRLTAIIGTIFIVFIIFGSILPILQMFMSKTNTLPLDTTDLPIVRLADVEQNPELVRNRSYSYIRNNVDWGQRYTYKWSLLGPVQYESNEHGIVPNAMWKDNSGLYSPSISTRSYRLSFSSMARSLVNDLIKRYGMSYKGGDFIEIEHEEFDILIIHEGEDYNEIIASKGRAVMHIQYFGYADINTLIENASQRISSILD